MSKEDEAISDGLLRKSELAWKRLKKKDKKLLHRNSFKAGFIRGLKDFLLFMANEYDIKLKNKKKKAK